MKDNFNIKDFIVARWLSNKYMPYTTLETIMYFYNKLRATKSCRKEKEND